VVVMTIGEQTEFKTMRVLIVSAKPHVVQVMRHVFAIVDVQHVSVTATANAGLERMCANRYGAVFYDDSCGEIGGDSFARAVRRHPSVTNPMVPLFLLCASPRRRDVERARDTGYSDVLLRPLSPAIVMRKLRQASENARPFIAAPDFFGPDRRAKHRPEFHGKDRRKRIARKVKVARESFIEI
jgi:CheY-like chemotaxis protein